MNLINENQELKEITEELMSNMKEYRVRAENRIMDTSTWDITHRLKLKSIADKMFELQIAMNEL